MAELSTPYSFIGNGLPQLTDCMPLDVRVVIYNARATRMMHCTINVHENTPQVYSCTIYHSNRRNDTDEPDHTDKHSCREMYKIPKAGVDLRKCSSMHGGFEWMKRVTNRRPTRRQTWTVHDGNFFAQSVRDNVPRAPNERRACGTASLEEKVEQLRNIHSNRCAFNQHKTSQTV